MSTSLVDRRCLNGCDLMVCAQTFGTLGGQLRTLMRLEQSHGVPPSRASTLPEIQKTFEAAGIEFIGTSDDGPGIRARFSSNSEPQGL